MADDTTTTTMDCTPTWTEILPVWLRLARQAYAEGNGAVIRNFESEMTRMAKLADLYVAHVQPTNQE